MLGGLPLRKIPKHSLRRLAGMTCLANRLGRTEVAYGGTVQVLGLALAVRQFCESGARAEPTGWHRGWAMKAVA